MASFGMGQVPSADEAGTIEPSTPWMAAADGNIGLLQSSIASLGLTYSIADENGYTLLMAAAAYNRGNIMEFLLASAAVDVNSQDYDGDTALHHVECVEAAKMLVEVGKANSTIRNGSGKTPMEAKVEEFKEIIEDDEDDDESLALKELVEYLRTIS